MMQQLSQLTDIDFSDDDVESWFSMDDEPTSDTIFQFAATDTEYSNSDDCHYFYHIQQAPQSLPSLAFSCHIPTAKVQIFPTKYSNPVSVIAFFDTGATRTIINPKILPASQWKPHQEIFYTANSETFITHLISKPIKIQIFPGCFTFHKVLGSDLPGKDMVLGFDVYSKLNKLRILPDGVRYKMFFQSWTTQPNLFQIEGNPIEQIKNQLISRSCADSHADFLTKCAHPLWKN